ETRRRGGRRGETLRWRSPLSSDPRFRLSVVLAIASPPIPELRFHHPSRFDPGLLLSSDILHSESPIIWESFKHFRFITPLRGSLLVAVSSSTSSSIASTGSPSGGRTKVGINGKFSCSL
ncbi:hypothetical protein GW17_00055442, partial [Ensete ventricosum]